MKTATYLKTITVSAEREGMVHDGRFDVYDLSEPLTVDGVAFGQILVGDDTCNDDQTWVVPTSPERLENNSAAWEYRANTLPGRGRNLDALAELGFAPINAPASAGGGFV